MGSDSVVLKSCRFGGTRHHSLSHKLLYLGASFDHHAVTRMVLTTAECASHFSSWLWTSSKVVFFLNLWEYREIIKLLVHVVLTIGDDSRSNQQHELKLEFSIKI